MQRAHWHAAHKAVCTQQGADGQVVAVVQPRSRQVSASICAGWQAAAQAACDLAYSGKYAEARASAERLLVTIEEALGPEAEELLVPLEVLNYTTRRAGQLDDSYTIMLRTHHISEKHHGEDGLMTCLLSKDRCVLGS